MKTYVINLPHSRERRANMSQRLDRTGLSPEFVEAVDGRALTAPQRAELVDEDTVARYPWWLTPGAIGCALSHLRVYQRVLATSEEVVLVLEDDTIVPPTVAEDIERIVPHMRGREVVLLYFRAFGPCHFSSQASVDVGKDMQLMYPLRARQPISSCAYLITGEACRGLNEVVLPVRAAADSWGHFYELGALESIRCVVPRLASAGKDFSSTIGTAGSTSLRTRASSFIAGQRRFPFVQLLMLNRYLVDRRMSRIRIVPEPSPIAVARHETRLT